MTFTTSRPSATFNAGGETGRSNEAATTPETINTPLYQIDAGGAECRYHHQWSQYQRRRSIIGNYVTDGGYQSRPI